MTATADPRPVEEAAFETQPAERSTAALMTQLLGSARAMNRAGATAADTYRAMGKFMGGRGSQILANATKRSWPTVPEWNPKPRGWRLWRWITDRPPPKPYWTRDFEGDLVYVEKPEPDRGGPVLGTVDQLSDDGETMIVRLGSRVWG